ncbi:response regulator [Thalassotalea atypica]|uniref:response regulator n=1 Tax=Thalassotalea atypica TaxID=2054316 RepID=UPI002573224B|nr:response regulator [Thalassotalea atypica]
MSKFIFKDEPTDSGRQPAKKVVKYWRILIIDDDESVHQVTKLVLADSEIEGRKLKLVSVYSKKEAIELLSEDQDFCMAFVDVVMETDHAGLELVEWIRQELKNQSIRLVLRTGQAGTAPEAKVIKEFDINDYKEKTDFTSGKMVTTVYAGIRAYRDIMTIQRSLDAFKRLINATHNLLQVNQLKQFGSAALNHLLTLMDIDSSALYIARNQIDFNQETSNMIIACTGKYVSESNCLESSQIDNDVKKLISKTFERKSHYSDEGCFIGYYETATNASSVLYIEFEDDNENFRTNLAELYATNVALILEGLSNKNEIERTQKELINIVSEAVEARGKENSAHVQRVASICEIFGNKLELSQPFIDALKLAAPLHDIGKIAIPEHILQKSGELNAEEWQIMQTHAESGAHLLSKSTASISKLGARLAHYHHENWDGSGYPEGLCGEEIPLEARIMAIADVFDTLGSKRCYQEIWQDDNIKEFIASQRGKKFEPRLVDIFIEHYHEFINIRALMPDD